MLFFQKIRSWNQSRRARTNGGIDAVRGGAIREEESIITPENGFTNITELPPGTSPDGYVQMLLDGGSPATPA